MPIPDPVLRALAESPIPIGTVVTRRADEAHCRVAAGAVKDVAAIACRDLGGELILIAAEDRRRAAGIFLVHYLFAHRTGHWFLHVSTPLDGASPVLPSLAPFIYPASRFEREIQDLFGIQ